MKKCEKCECEFPVIVKIDGKPRNLNSRKFCLKCSPFNTHNTKKLNLPNCKENMKICTLCKTEKNLDCFYTIKNNKKYCYCIDCQRNKNNIAAQDTKRKCVEYKGGKCQICGYSKYQGSLDFHHLDETEKEFSIGHAHMKKFENLKSELDKCILVCRNCHCEIHGKIIQVKPEDI